MKTINVLLNVLLAEDDPDDVRLAKLALSPFGSNMCFNFKVVGTLYSAIECLKTENFDVVLLDLGLPDSKGMQTLKKVRGLGLQSPIIVIAGLEDEAVVLQAINEGAFDYLIKGRFYKDELRRTIHYAIEHKKIEDALRKAHDELEGQVEQRTAELAKSKQELEIQAWGLKKANKGIRILYKELEEKDKRIQELGKIKSDFVSHVSHELRIPMAAIKESINIVLDGVAGKINNQQRKFLDIAKRNVNRLVRLINNVLDFQKFESGKMQFDMQLNDINEVVTDVYKTMAISPNCREVDFSLKLEDNLPKVRFDRDKIIQVLTNLVSNATKFVDKGNITVATSRAENAVGVSVSDTGCGIRKEDLPKLFQKFGQLAEGNNSKTGGTGLGLAISKEIIKQHKGRIWVESEFGKGTTFRIILPCSKTDSLLNPKS